MAIRNLLFAVLIATSASLPTFSRAQAASSAAPAYDRGVHEYFAGNCGAAERTLILAVAENPENPLPYYFRALSLLRLGRIDEARNDMQVGADLEARNTGRYAIGRALERVQGSNRLMLERYRRRARASANIQSDQRQPSRYEAGPEQGASVLRQRVSVPLEELMTPGSMSQWTRGTAGLVPNIISPSRTHLQGESPGDPFVDDPQPIATESTETSDPFAVVTPVAEDSNAKGGYNEGTVPIGKLMGVVGRAISGAAPVPDLERLREEIPLPPQFGGQAETMNPPGTLGAPPDGFSDDGFDSFDDGENFP